ncbi:hypothetical protein BDR26DRAFT_427752 [Obelidium mucronatum]|nr:hypothetical protein BDR26DRAFT_427752 [Obelidium mucronatum]
MSKVWNLTRHAMAGVIFGFALEKAKVYLPSVIIGQMQWTQLEMLVVFLSATVVGLVGVTVLEKLGVYERCVKPPMSAGINALGIYGSNILGGAGVGAGMALSGACPGTAFLQFATGVPHSPFLFAGLLVGSITFGTFHKYLTKHFLPAFGSKNPSKTFDGVLGVSIQTIAVGACFLGFPLLWFINSQIDWRNDYSKDMTHDFLQFEALGFNPFAPAWSPIHAGIAVGISQITHIVLTGSMIGASAVYPYMGSLFVRAVDPNWKTNTPYYSGYVDLAHSLRFTGGVMAGAALSAWMGGFKYGAGMIGSSSGSIPGNVFVEYGVGSMARVVGGGVLLVYGSRVAGGCTSGHGLSGLAQLGVASLVTIAAMFAAGTAVAAAVGPLPGAAVGVL